MGKETLLKMLQEADETITWEEFYGYVRQAKEIYINEKQSQTKE